MEPTLSGAPFLPAAAPPLIPLPTQMPSRARQRLVWVQTLDCAQSEFESARHAPSFAEHVPSSLQRDDFAQSALDEATHVPFFSPHLPSVAQAFDFLHSSAVATHAPSFAEH